MAIRKVMRGEKACLFLDIRYRRKDGTKARFRRDAKVQTMAAARTEEKRYLMNIAQYGEPYAPGEERAAAAQRSGKTFRDVVEEYRATFMVTELKVTSRRGYEGVLEGMLVPRFGGIGITKVDGPAATLLDVELAEKGLARATRNNVQVVIRSVLRFAVERKYLKERPTGLPKLKQVGQSILEIPSDADVDKILEGSSELHRLTFGLVAFAGLRPNEVRGLRRRDVRLRRENGVAVGGFLSVREGRSHGEVHTPKTGQREVAIAPELARLLDGVEQGGKDELVAVNERGEGWGQYGIAQAFERVRKRVGLDGWSVYALRHYAITSWLRAGVPVHVVQRMAGHKHLATTQRYVHYLKEDLEEAGRRLGQVRRGA